MRKYGYEELKKYGYEELLYNEKNHKLFDKSMYFWLAFERYYIHDHA